MEYEEERLNKLRAEIVRFAGRKNEVRDILGKLVMTDWDAYYPSETTRVECVQCRQKAMYRDTIPYTGGYVVTSRCDKTYGYNLCLECHNQFCCICKTTRAQRPEAGYDRLVCWSCMDKWDFDSDWLRKEYQKISIQEGRSNREYDLSVRIWLDRLVHFNFKCAYCLENPYSCIEHFIPVNCDGVTSPANCVPACRKCNSAKHGNHPDKVTRIPRESLDRVKSYLSQFS